MICPRGEDLPPFLQAFKHWKLLRRLRIRRQLEKLIRMEKVARNEKSCSKYEKLPKNVAEQRGERPNHVRVFKIYRSWAIVLGGGEYFRNFWVRTCRWDPGTLSLYQSWFSCILLPYTSLNSPNSSYPRVAVFQKQLRSLAQSSPNKTDLIFRVAISGFSSLD